VSIYYSPSKEGFYDTDVIQYLQLPEDIIELTHNERSYYVSEMNHNNKKLVVEDDTLTLIEREEIVTWESVRLKRNVLLNDTDHTQVTDYPGDRIAWTEYRQALRDIPQIYKMPKEVVWPVQPK
jgi:hypothetical protein